MMDGCTFLHFKMLSSIHCHYKAWKNIEFFKYNGFLDKEKIAVKNIFFYVLVPIGTW